MKEHNKQTEPLTFTLTKTKANSSIDLKTDVSPNAPLSLESNTNKKEKK